MRRCLPACLSIFPVVFLVVILFSVPAALASAQKEDGNAIKVMAVQTFLADIAQNVAGDRVMIRALLPVGADVHSFEPTPADVGEIAESNVLIINGAGLEEYLYELLKNVGGVHKIIDASAGLSFRAPLESETTGSDGKDHRREAAIEHGEAHRQEGEHQRGAIREDGDPHFWLSAANAVQYVENISKGLSEADPAGAEIYAANSRAYIEKLRELDKWISDQVKLLPENRRLLVTDHDEFGYFADHYGLRIVGMIVPSFSTEASPSAKEITELVRTIRKTGAKAIFLEAGGAPQLAEQVAKEAGIKVVTGLYTHSLSKPDGPAPNYIEMMRYDTMTIVNALE
jgi:ABC-type Zn uptake system ZnuABC Zn-binding protein ZnuA